MLNSLKDTLAQREIRESWQGLTRPTKVNVNESERLLSIAGGGLLTLYGLFRLSGSSLFYLLGGGYLLYRGLTGHCPAYEAAGHSTASRAEQLQFESKNQAAPDQQLEPAESVDSDSQVDETGWETFPASDPPAWTSSRAGT